MAFRKEKEPRHVKTYHFISRLIFIHTSHTIIIKFVIFFSFDMNSNEKAFNKNVNGSSDRNIKLHSGLSESWCMEKILGEKNR